MDKTMKEQLMELADADYQKFSAALLPTIDNVIGVRLPELRKLAKTIAKGTGELIWSTPSLIILKK